MEEAELLMELKHPNIVKCYDVFKPTTSDPDAYIVMELMDLSLDDVLDTVGHFSEK